MFLTLARWFLRKLQTIKNDEESMKKLHERQPAFEHYFIISCNSLKIITINAMRKKIYLDRFPTKNQQILT